MYGWLSGDLSGLIVHPRAVLIIRCPFLQVVLINAVKDVAKALAELISATKCAAGKTADDPSMYQLKSAAKVNGADRNDTFQQPEIGLSTRMQHLSTSLHLIPP